MHQLAAPASDISISPLYSDYKWYTTDTIVLIYNAMWPYKARYVLRLRPIREVYEQYLETWNFYALKFQLYFFTFHK